MSCRSAKVDRLGLLPDELLAQILSLMPTKSAVGTSILSKRWRYSWTLVHSLDFHYTGDIDSFLSFVDRVLTLCKTSQLKLFRLDYTEFVDGNIHVAKWISELNVCELDLNITAFGLPLSLFACKTLTKLSIAGWGRHGLEDFCQHIPSVIILPLLKTLDMNVPGIASVNTFRLINGCLMLESLSLSIAAICIQQQDYNFNIPSLKRLKLRIISYISLTKVILNVPSLEYLCVVGLLSSLFVIQDASSLVEATVGFSYIDENLKHLYAKLLKGISGAKSVSCSSPSLHVLLKSPLPKFPNLKHLDLRGSLHSRSLNKLFRHLESSSELEHLCFQEPKKSCWIELQSVPTWMLTNLKTMKITKCKGRECDLQFIEYVLGNSEVLKTLTIKGKKSFRRKDEMRLCGQLSTFSRASRYCHIHFVGKWLSNIF